MKRRRYLAYVSASAGFSGCSSSAQQPSSAPSHTPKPNNPWGRSPIRIGFSVGKQASENTYTRPAITEAVKYWNSNKKFIKFDSDLAFTPLLNEVEIEVQLRDSINYCDGKSSDNYFGCAQIIDPNDTLEHRSTPIQVKVADNLGRCVTRETVKHELGHALGLRHYDEPADVMRSKFNPNNSSNCN